MSDGSGGRSIQEISAALVTLAWLYPHRTHHETLSLRLKVIISCATHLSSAGSYSAPGAIPANPQQVLTSPLGTTRNWAPVGSCVMRSQSTLNCSALTCFGIMHRQCAKGAKVA